MDIQTHETEVIIENKVVDNSVISIGEWITILLLLSIPIVNIVIAIVWLSGDKTSQTKKNYIYAILIFMAAAFMISLLLGASFVSLLSTLG